MTSTNPFPNGSTTAATWCWRRALSNLMRMTRTGGTLFLSTPANNLCGYGFYQFSPELMFRIFSPVNGFDPPRVTLLEGILPAFELTPVRRVYDVADPSAVRCRVGLRSRNPAMMAVQARRLRMWSRSHRLRSRAIT